MANLDMLKNSNKIFLKEINPYFCFSSLVCTTGAGFIFIFLPPGSGSASSVRIWIQEISHNADLCGSGLETLFLIELILPNKVENEDPSPAWLRTWSCLSICTPSGSSAPWRLPSPVPVARWEEGSGSLLLDVQTPVPPVEALRSLPVRLVGRQCALKHVDYLLWLPTVLPGTNFCAMADLNKATNVLDLVLWLSLFQSSVTRVPYEFFLTSSLHLLTVRFNGTVVKRVILSSCAPTLLNSSSGRTLSFPLSIL